VESTVSNMLERNKLIVNLTCGLIFSTLLTFRHFEHIPGISTNLLKGNVGITQWKI